MRHFFKYADRTNAKYVAQNTVQNCLKPTTPSRSTGVRTHVWCHSVGNQMAEVTKPNRTICERNMNNIKTAVENANLCGKIWDMHTLLEYAKKAAISKICGNHIFIVHLSTCILPNPNTTNTVQSAQAAFSRHSDSSQHTINSIIIITVYYTLKVRKQCR